MKKLLQYKFEDYEFDVSEAKYDYISYDINEAIKNDELIDKSDNNSSKVTIPIKFKPTLTDSQRAYLTNFTSLMFESINNKKLTNNQIFTKINKNSKNYFRYFHDKKNKELSLTIEKLGIQNASRVIENLSEGFQLNINKELENDFNDFCKGLISYNKNDFIPSDTLDLTADNDLSAEWFLDNPTFDLNSTPIFTRDAYQDDIYYESACIGFLIEKFDDNKKLIAEKFYLIDNIFNNTDKFDKIIEDTYVKYGKEYTYVIYPTFLTTMPARNNYHVSETYLFCDSPYITKVECKEYINPESPCAINFSLDKNKNLHINWSRSFNYNIQNDTAGYIIFKRHSIKEPYKVVKVINFLNENDYFKLNELNNIDENMIDKHMYHVTQYIDKDFNEHRVSIYTLCSYDAHGNFSNYSDQLSLLYNPVSKDLEVNLVSKSGAPLNFPNLNIPRNIKYFGYQESIEDVVPVVKNKTKFTLYSTPDFVNYDDHNGLNQSLLKENYVFNIFKLENQKSFKDIIKIKNFNLR